MKVKLKTLLQRAHDRTNCPDTQPLIDFFLLLMEFDEEKKKKGANEKKP
jgi:hypothetical protein